MIVTKCLVENSESTEHSEDSVLLSVQIINHWTEQKAKET